MTGHGKKPPPPQDATAIDASWHESRGLWRDFGPVMFEPGRMAKTPAEVDLLIDLLKLTPPGPLLDLCCGIGRHALEFAGRGYEVTGVDITEDFLRRAKETADGKGLAVEWVRDDVRRFVRPGSYKAALSLYNSFGYFRDPRDDSKVLGNVYRSLQPGGKILLELKSRETFKREFRPVTEREIDGTNLREDLDANADFTWATSRWTLKRGATEKSFTFGYRLYSEAELVALLKSVGFAHVKSFGNLAGTPYDAHAVKLVIVAQKE